MESVHGHDVLHMMMAAPTPFTEATLLTAMKARFGADARYHTCSARDMDAEGLVAFLRARGKFDEAGDTLSAAPERMCGGGDHDHDHQ